MTRRAKKNSASSVRRKKAVVLNRLDAGKTKPADLEAVRATYGAKAAGLLSLPPYWTPQFIAIPTSLYSKWRAKGSKISKALNFAAINLETYLRKFHELGFDQVIVRSSAADEDMNDRGRFISLVQEKSATAEQIAKTINQIYSNYSRQRPRGQIGIIIQGYIPSEIGGHLSNEIHLTPTRNQWRYEIDRPAYAPPQGLNSKFSSSPDEGKRILKIPDEAISQVLRRIAHWINIKSSRRSHLEWCLKKNTIWLLQVDSESETSEGADPRRAPPLRNLIKLTDAKLSEIKTFKSYRVGNSTPWAKLQNLNDFAIGDDEARHRLFYATAASVKKVLGTAQGSKALHKEIEWRTFGRAVIRTDSISDKIPKFNLPRTHTMSGRAAIAWLKEQIEKFEVLGVDLNEICFITHGFIPARAAAWTYYRPGAEIVEIDALWGLPDGLQFLPHDSFQCDPSSGQVLSEKIRFKPQFLQEQADGTWRYVPIARQFSRIRTLSSEALEAIAVQTVAISEKIKAPAQIMWFCDIPADLGLGEHLPWYRTKEAADRQKITTRSII